MRFPSFSASTRRRPTRHHLTLAVAGVSFGLVASLTTALPGYAVGTEPTAAVAQSARLAVQEGAHPSLQERQQLALRSLIVAAAQRGEVQSLDVSTKVAKPAVQADTFGTVDVAAELQTRYGIDRGMALQLLATSAPQARAAIVSTGASYLGTPYVLDGASHGGIDCSGLVMVAYAAAGVNLAHLVSAQDAAGHRIAAGAAEPGDLVVFDDDAHVGIYMGGGMVLHAPTEGRDVELDSLSTWAGVGYHFTRILN